MKTPKAIRVLHVPVGQAPVVKRVSLEPGIDLWLNEEGKLIGLLPNLWDDRYGMIVGDVFVARHDGEGNTIGLTPNDVKRLTARLGKR